MSLTIEDLKTFVVVCEAGSLSAAARRFDVPVSTISRRLFKFEEEIGQTVFDRTGRGVVLREQTRDFLNVVQTTLHELEAGMVRLREGASRPLNRLRISASRETSISLLPDAIMRCRAEAPDLTFEVIAERRNVSVIEENYDLALRLGHQFPGDLIAWPLGSISMHVMASPRYLAGQKITHPEQLSEHDVMTVAGTGSEWVFRTARKKEILVRLSGSVVVTSFTEAARLAALGGGLAILPSFTRRAWAASLDLVSVLPKYTLPVAQLTALYPQRNRGAEAISLLCTHLGAILQADASEDV